MVDPSHVDTACNGFGATGRRGGAFIRLGLSRCLDITAFVPTPSVLRGLRDRDVKERLVRQSELDWTIFKPPRLINGPAVRSTIGTDRYIGCLAPTTVNCLAEELQQERLAPKFVDRRYLSSPIDPACPADIRRDRSSLLACFPCVTV